MAGEKPTSTGVHCGSDYEVRFIPTSDEQPDLVSAIIIPPQGNEIMFIGKPIQVAGRVNGERWGMRVVLGLAMTAEVAAIVGGGSTIHAEVTNVAGVALGFSEALSGAVAAFATFIYWRGRERVLNAVSRKWSEGTSIQYPAIEQILPNH